MDLSRCVAVIDRFVGALEPVDEADRAAGLELAAASRRFSHRTKAVVDDKLSFSATLMRAGEVEAANRLLAEVENEVLTEEAALFEKVNEVKVARAIERRPVTRLGIARALAVAILGSSLLASSAVGMAVAGLFRDRDRSAFSLPSGTRDVGRRVDAAVERRSGAGVKKINVAGVHMRLTRAELRQYKEITSGSSIDEDRLETFLLSVLPAPLAEQVRIALVVASKVTPDSVEEPLADLARKVNDERRKAQGREAAQQESNDDGTEPADEPSPNPSESSGDETKDRENGDDPGDLPIVGGKL